MPVNTDCLYSTLKNTSGGTKFFGFIPPHGRDLDADETVTVFGNIADAVNRMNPATSERHRAGLRDSVLAGDIEIVSTPAPVVLDGTTGETKILTLDDGSVVVADPGWVELTSESASSSASA